MKSPYKIFLSYSHEDETLAKQLKAHASTLINNQIVELWFDRQLIAGSYLEEEIKEKLKKADIFVFLVSSDFLASYYCIRVELEIALKRDGVTLIPLIARDCDWKDSVLGSFTALPADGRPLSMQNDIDLAFNECIQQLKKVISELDQKALAITTKSEHLIEQSCPKLNREFEKWLNSSDIIFQHREKDEVQLNDIYVYPDLEVKNDDDNKAQQLIISSSKLIKGFNKSSKSVLILGGEQSGKSSLAKVYFLDIFGDQAHPLFFDCSSISSTKSLDKDIRKACSKQYENLNGDDYISNPSRKIALLDNFDKLRLNAKYAKILIDRLLEKFDFNQVLIFADSDIKYEKDKMDIFDEFETYMILRFGYAKREELISKWNSIGVIETISNEQLEKLNKASRLQVDAIIRKNVVPSKPFFVLSILQLLETSRPSEYSLTSYGHCYHYLITGALKNANIPVTEYNTYINYLTQLANAIYKLGSSSIDKDELADFQSAYSREFMIGSHEKVLSKLLETSLLKKKDGELSFGYKYIFYFYVAKYIAENITHENSKEVLSDLCDKIHTERHANILIFVTHHSKDEAIIDEILAHTSMIFDGQKEATLSVEDFSHMEDVLSNLPKTIIEQRNVESEKQKRLKRKDELEKPSGDDDDLLEEDLEESDQSLAEINRSARMIEVIGQILRNRHGDLSKSDLKDFIESGFGSGLRFLDWYIRGYTAHEQEIIEIIEQKIIEIIKDLLKENKYFNDASLKKTARLIYVNRLYWTSFLVLNKLCYSMGSENLISLFKIVASENPDSAAIQIINLAIQLEFGNGIPFKLLKQLKNKYRGNFIAEKLLQKFAVGHVYLHYVSIEDKQRLSDLLGIKMSYQRQLENRSQVKQQRR